MRSLASQVIFSSFRSQKISAKRCIVVRWRQSEENAQRSPATRRKATWRRCVGNRVKGGQSQGTTFASPLGDPGNARPSCPPPKRAPLRLSTNDDARRLVLFTTRRVLQSSPTRGYALLTPDYLVTLRMQFLIDDGTHSHVTAIYQNACR